MNIADIIQLLSSQAKMSVRNGYQILYIALLNLILNTTIHCLLHNISYYLECIFWVWQFCKGEWHDDKSAWGKQGWNHCDCTKFCRGRAGQNLVKKLIIIVTSGRVISCILAFLDAGLLAHSHSPKVMFFPR